MNIDKIDRINDNIIYMNKNKVQTKFEKLKDMKFKNEYIYKDMSIDNIDEIIRPNILKKNVNMEDIYNMCFKDNNRPFCEDIKEFYKPLDNINEFVRTPLDFIANNKIRNINKDYYSNYYNYK